VRGQAPSTQRQHSCNPQKLDRRVQIKKKKDRRHIFSASIASFTAAMMKERSRCGVNAKERKWSNNRTIRHRPHDHQRAYTLPIHKSFVRLWISTNTLWAVWGVLLVCLVSLLCNLKGISQHPTIRLTHTIIPMRRGEWWCMSGDRNP
jgi:hypothetical protein